MSFRNIVSEGSGGPQTYDPAMNSGPGNKLSNSSHRRGVSSVRLGSIFKSRKLCGDGGSCAYVKVGTFMVAFPVDAYRLYYILSESGCGMLCRVGYMADFRWTRRG